MWGSSVVSLGSSLLGDYLLYLDPHTTHPVVKTGDTRDIPDGTYHCSKTDMMHYQELDPSLALVGVTSFILAYKSHSKDYSPNRVFSVETLTM